MKDSSQAKKAAKHIKAIIFDLDDTLIDSTTLSNTARKEAVKAMIRQGLPAKSVKEAYARLNRLVQKYGTNYPKHFNRLCETYGIHHDPRIVAAGIMAYHNVKFTSLCLHPGTKETLSSLRKKGYLLILVTCGIPIKQWEKIFRIGIERYFDMVLINRHNKHLLYKKALKKLKCSPADVLCIGDRLNPDIYHANMLGFFSVRIRKGRYRSQRPKKATEKPCCEIKAIDRLLPLLGH